MAFQVALVVKNPPANVGDPRDLGSIPGSVRSPGGGHGNPLQHSCLENPMDRGAWWAVVHRIVKSRTWLKLLGAHTVFPAVMEMCELDHEEGWAPKNRCFRIVLKRTIQSPLDGMKIKPVNSKGNQPWLFIGKTAAEALVLWPRDVKSQHSGKDPDAEKGWRREKKGAAEDEMAGWHHRRSGHGLEQMPGGGGGEASVVYCSPGGR